MKNNPKADLVIDTLVMALLRRKIGLCGSLLVRTISSRYGDGFRYIPRTIHEEVDKRFYHRVKGLSWQNRV